MTLEERISRYFDGGLGAAQVTELDALLRDSAEARETYREIAATHVLLDQAHEEESGADWAEPVQPRKIVFRWLPAAAAAVPEEARSRRSLPPRHQPRARARG